MKKKILTLITMFLPMLASASVTENGTRGTGDINIGVILNNRTAEDIYLTGHMYLAVGEPGTGDWGPINIDIDPVSEGCAGYLVPAGQSAVVPYYMINYSVNSKDPNEVVAKYLYGPIYAFIYCRAYSWTDAHDPAVIQTECASQAFIPGDYVVFNLVAVRHEEGRITPCPNALNLGSGSYVNPDPVIPDPDPVIPDPDPVIPDPDPVIPDPDPFIPEPDPEPAMQCETPSIEYSDGKLYFSCETEDVTYNYTIIPTPANGRTEDTVDLAEEEEPLTFTVVVIASKSGYRDSEEAIEVFPFFGERGVFGDLNGDGVVNAADHVELSNIIMNQSK